MAVFNVKVLTTQETTREFSVAVEAKTPRDAEDIAMEGAMSHPDRIRNPNVTRILVLRQIYDAPTKAEIISLEHVK
jgi:hypothetical protein